MSKAEDLRQQAYDLNDKAHAAEQAGKPELAKYYADQAERLLEQARIAGHEEDK